MKLCAIYNVWDGEELLEGSIRQIRDHVDIVIAVVSYRSSYGEKRAEGFNVCKLLQLHGLIDVVNWYDPPNNDLKAMSQESVKRSEGLKSAKEHGATHFLYMDCDEYYFTNDFVEAKARYLIREATDGIEGSVCQMKTYFKSPTLMLDPPEDYYVPFIHKLTEETETGLIDSRRLRPYPFFCDPTRRVNTNKVEDLSEVVTMHHYSYVRKDVERKIRNSSARTNIERTPILHDYENAKEGYNLKYCNKKLILAKNHFNISI